MICYVKGNKMDEVLQMEHVASVQGSKSEKGEQATEQESIPTYLATSA